MEWDKHFDGHCLPLLEFWHNQFGGQDSQHVRHEMVCKLLILTVGSSVWLVIARVGRLEQLSFVLLITGRWDTVCGSPQLQTAHEDVMVYNDHLVPCWMCVFVQ